GLILGTISFCAAVLVSLTYILTKPIIAQQSLNIERKSISTFLPDVEKIEKVENEAGIYYKCYREGKLLGYALVVLADGYSSNIKLIAVIDSKKIIKGIKVLEQQETPGLGTKITEPWFEDQFKNKETGRLVLGKDIEAISGATISSNAVVEAVKKEIEQFKIENED
ncbi:MAG: RnfABCDGE type electron transport complex subunit G, partial [Candidatus Omnitrophica bacterium]|nr:RnfABCDGE type electron transport complex subunit G [Candidatus Omnitrophota bacterium]